MKAPCLDCPDRTITPNCHSTCEKYQLFSAECEKIRALKTQEHEANWLRTVGAKRIRKQVLRKR